MFTLLQACVIWWTKKKLWVAYHFTTFLLSRLFYPIFVTLAPDIKLLSSKCALYWIAIIICLQKGRRQLFGPQLLLLPICLKKMLWPHHKVWRSQSKHVWGESINSQPRAKFFGCFILFFCPEQVSVSILFVLFFERCLKFVDKGNCSLLEGSASKKKQLQITESLSSKKSSIFFTHAAKVRAKLYNGEERRAMAGLGTWSA